MQKHQHGGDIYTNDYKIDFSANINPWGTPESVILAAQQGILESMHYPDVQCRELKSALAVKEGVKEEQIICGNGAAELIFSYAMGMKPSQALLVAPGFAEYEQALQAVGCKIHLYHVEKEHGFELQEDYLEYVTKDLDVIFLCNPNNPTGVRIRKNLLDKILDKAKDLGIFVVLDSCFIEFMEQPEEADYAGQLEQYPNLFILKAFTKMYAMAGLRLGYGLCGDPAVLENMRSVMQPWSVSIPAQKAGCAAIKEEEFVRSSREKITTERRWLTEKMRQLGLLVYEGAANYLFFEATKGLSEACKKQGILIRDCSNYRGLSEGYYRVAVRTREENEELVKVLELVLKEF